MGTSLSGLTPATTFDGLLKVGDNDPLTAILKAISTGDGTDTILSLSNSALKIGGDTEIDSSELNALIVKRNGTELLKSDGSGLNGALIFTGNLTNKFSLGVRGNDFNIWDGSYLGGGDLRFSILADGKTAIGAQTPTAQLHIKGSGNDATTTSLLVQNSAGNDLFSIKDNGLFTFKDDGGGDALTIENGSNISQIRYNDNLWLGSSHGTYVPTLKIDRLNGLSVETNSGSLLNLLYTNGNLGIGETTPTARLHVKGSGNSSATNAFFVENSTGNDLFRVVDNGLIYMSNDNYIFSNSQSQFNNKLGIGTTPDSSTQLHVKGSGNDNTTTSLLVQNSDGAQLFKVSDFGYSEFNQNATFYSNIYISGSIIGAAATKIGIGGPIPASTQAYIKGSGATSATTALLVQNSAGTRIMEAQDGGNIFFGASASHYLQNGYNWFGSYYFLNTQTFRGALQNDLGSVKISDDLNVGGNADNDTGVRLQVKGSGNDATTTALLVENSAGTQLFKIFDDGNIRIGDSIANKETHFRKFRITDASIFPLSSGNLGENDNTARHYGNIYSLGVTHITDNTTSSTTLDASAKLQVDSTTQGFLPPRMTDAERDAITNPAAGLMIYDTSNNQMNYWNGSTWIAF